MIYDLSYFKNELHIPNITEDANIVSNNSELLEVIRNADVKFLTDCFGFNIAKQILEATDANGDIIAGTNPVIEKLIVGDNTIDWLGLRYEINGVKKSILANHSFCQYVYQDNSQLTQVGNTQDNVQNGNRVSNWLKYVPVWNEMMNQRQKEYDIDYYWFKRLRNTYGITLEEFIIKNQETFDLSKFTYYEKVNTLGL